MVQRVEKMTRAGKHKICESIDKEGEQLENYTKYKLKEHDELERRIFL